MKSDDFRLEDSASTVASMKFGALRSQRSAQETRTELDRYLDVELDVAVEVGATHATLDQILDLVPGTVLRLDKRAGDPVDLRVNGMLVARGEVVKVDDCYGVRITSIVESSERTRSR